MEIQDARKKIVDYLRSEIGHHNNSIVGERPDSEGKYTESRDIIKATRDTIYAIINIFDLDDKTLSSFDSLEDYLKDSAVKVFSYPEDASMPVISYLEKEFDIKLEKPEGPSLFYKGYMKGIAEAYDLDIAELKALIPYEEFEKLKPGEPTRIIFRHFNLG